MVWSSGGSPFDLTHRCEPRVDRLTPRRHHPVDVVPYLALISAVAALGLAFFYYKAVEKESPGDERMVFLMTEIQKGARAFLCKPSTPGSAIFVDCAGDCARRRDCSA